MSRCPLVDAGEPLEDRRAEDAAVRVAETRNGSLNRCTSFEALAAVHRVGQSHGAGQIVQAVTQPRNFIGGRLWCAWSRRHGALLPCGFAPSSGSAYGFQRAPLRAHEKWFHRVLASTGTRSTL